MKRFQEIFAAFAAALLTLCVSSCGYFEKKPSDGSESLESFYEASESLFSGEEGEALSKPDGAGVLTVHFLDVGQGDSIFIELPNGGTMLIDCGTAEQGDRIVTYIFEQGYDTVDSLVLTHPHSDHTGGAFDVLNTLNVKSVVLTEAFEDTSAYETVTGFADGESISFARAGDVLLSEEGLLAECAAPSTFEVSDLNDTSLVIKLTYGENAFVFAGDAEKPEEDSIRTNIKCDVLKVGHHGSASSTSRNFLKKTEPEYAVISCGLQNSYGHPTEAVLKRLRERNVALFRTDIQGTVVFRSDGESITVNKPPAEYPPETSETSATSAASESAPDAAYSYVLNTSTRRIHLPDCPSVKDIKDKNKAFTDDLGGAIAEGYKPCGSCKPA